MAPLTMDKLKGNWATLLLSLTPSAAIDWDLLAHEVDYLIGAGVDGIYSNGTAGEFYNLEEEEIRRVNEILAQKCQVVGMPYQIGASDTNPTVSLRRIENLKHLLPSAFQVILPDWVAPTADEQVAFLTRIAEQAAPAPLVLYNPPHAKRLLTPPALDRLADLVPALIGIKVAGGDRSWYVAMKPLADKLAIFVPGHHLATGMAAGVAAGAYSNVACLSPLGAQRWYTMMLSDMNEALAIEQLLLGFFNKAIDPLKEAGYSNPALDKFLAAVGGWCPISTMVRWPYSSVPEAALSQARKDARKMLPSFFFEH
ncbi:dihydrodipicolinate synthase family protein [Parapedobacter pyrenivorans]|uniref:Dihydrodipicolinate synthase family protein n=1 Tax=Parapedobacter pyrenivorans TaxID=1305674 RepID=A0A917MA36_9SPHI|nr:dihydrodipicolinate synthase family protein [Parapedobacter pyrenivorans]GGG87193.1 dihydrodipicolinate synthase family protein [Parapedobacter pyrenivorans]